MTNRIEKIEILSEQTLDKLIQTYDFERFSCSGDVKSETDNIVRIAIYSDFDMFDELAEQLSNSDYGFRIYGGDKGNKKYAALEIY